MKTLNEQCDQETVSIPGALGSQIPQIPHPCQSNLFINIKVILYGDYSLSDNGVWLWGFHFGSHTVARNLRRQHRQKVVAWLPTWNDLVLELYTRRNAIDLLHFLWSPP